MNDYEELLKLHRRNLHMIPELDRDLPETKKYLLSVLEQLNCKMTFLCGSGICAYFDKGQKETYGFRADMDGLPVQETNTCITVPHTKTKCMPAATTATWLWS